MEDFPDIIKGYSKVEYLITFGAIIFGFVAAEYFNGWGQLWRNRKRVKFSWIYFAYTVIAFFVLVVVWWNFWLQSQYIEKSIIHFHLLLGYPVIYYLISVFLFPDFSSYGLIDLSNFFFRQKKKFFLAVALFFVFDSFNAMAYGDDFDGGFRVIGIVISLCGAFIDNTNFHKFLLAVSVLAVIIYVVALDLGYMVPEGSDTLNNQYSKVEHLTVFISLLYGFVAAEFFMGWGSMIRNSKKIQFSWIHFLWSIFLLALLIDIWWSGRTQLEFISSHLSAFLLFLAIPLFFIC